MNGSDFFRNAAIVCFLFAFAIFIVVGWAHGGKYQMSHWDPALKNEISPFGKKCLLIACIFIAISIGLGALSVLFVS